MKRVILAVVIASMAAGGAAAAPATLLQHWDTNTVRAGLMAVGATDIRLADADGLPMITARTRDGLGVALYAKACDASAKGTIRLSRYVDFDGGVTPDNLRAQLTAYFALAQVTARSLWRTSGGQ